MVVFSCLLVIVEVSSGFTRGSDSFTGAFSLLGIWYRLLEVAGSLGGEVGSAAAFRALASVSRFELHFHHPSSSSLYASFSTQLPSKGVVCRLECHSSKFPNN